MQAFFGGASRQGYHHTVCSLVYMHSSEGHGSLISTSTAPSPALGFVSPDFPRRLIEPCTLVKLYVWHAWLVQDDTRSTARIQ